MLFTINYFIKRAIREGIKSLAVPLLAFTLIVLINTLGGIKEWLDYQYNNTMDNHPIIAELSDLTGEITDGLIVDMDTINLFLQPDSAVSLYNFTGEMALKRSLDIHLGEDRPETIMVGISAVAADDNLDPETGAVVTFFDGYDEDILKTEELVCIINEDILEFVENGIFKVTTSVTQPDRYESFIEPLLNPDIVVRDTFNNTLSILVQRTDTAAQITSISIYDDETLKMYMEHYPEWINLTEIGHFEDGTQIFTYEIDLWLWFDPSKKATVTVFYTPGETLESVMDLTVIGTVSGAENNNIYIPFWTVNSFIEELDENMLLYSERLNITLADNRDLVEFKNLASLSFSRVRPVRSTLPFAMTIYDSTFYETIEPLLQNTILVDIAIPIVYVIAVSVGFLASTLLTRQRKSEFAVMRSVGIHRRDVFFGVFSEQLILSLIGALMGCAVTFLIFRDLILERPAILLGCYLLGTIFAAIRVAGTNVLKVMKEKE